MSQQNALKVSDYPKIRQQCIKKLKNALGCLRTGGCTKVEELKVARTWTISGSRIKRECTPLHLSDGDKTEVDQIDIRESISLVLSIALDSLAVFLRGCLKEGCQELFLAEGKKQFCSNACAMAAAKKRYRKRKLQERKEK